MSNNLSFEDKFLQNTEVKGFRVILSGIIDAAFLFVLIVFIVRHFVMFSLWDKVAEKSPALIFLINFFIYRLCFLLFFKRTLGMIFCKLKYLNRQLNELPFLQRILMTFFINTDGVKVFKNKT